MALWTIHKHTVHYKYKANLCSKATIFVFVSGMFMMVLPLLIVYRNHGFWKKIDIYQEQPNIHFKNKMIIILEGKNYDCFTDETKPISASTSEMLEGSETSVEINRINISTETEIPQQPTNIMENVTNDQKLTTTFIKVNSSERNTEPLANLSSTKKSINEEYWSNFSEAGARTTFEMHTIKRLQREIDENRKHVEPNSVTVTSALTDDTPGNSNAVFHETSRQTRKSQDEKKEQNHCSTVITWSTLFTYNHLYYSNLRSATLTSHEDDLNRDGKKDVLYFTVKIPLKDKEEIFSVKAVLAFDYQLHMMNQLHMESLAYIDFNSPLSGYMFTIIGDLVLKQRKPFKYMEKNLKSDVPFIPENSLDINDYKMGQIFASYSKKTATTQLQDIYTIWSPGRNHSFQLKGTIFYPEEEIKYIPGVHEMFKWAWIQYLSFLIIFYFIFNRIKTFVLKNNMIPSIETAPWKIHEA